MLSAVVVGVLAAQAQTVTFTHACASAEVVLRDLGKELGVTMKPSGSVLQDYFLVRFDGAPVDEALEKIATTLNATWSEKGGVRYLGRTHAQELADAKEEKDAQAKVIQDWLEKRAIKEEYTPALAKKMIEAALPLMKSDRPGGVSSMQALQALDAQSPSGRFLTRVIKEIGIETFADLGPDDQVTYALQPNTFQRRLPNGEAMRMFEKENAVQKAAILETGAAERGEQNGGYFSELVSPYVGTWYATDESSVTVRKVDMSITVQVRVKGGGYSSVFINPSDSGKASIPDLLAKQAGKYEASPMEKELGTAAAVLFAGRGGNAEVSPETVELLQDPVANEPLSLLGSRWMLESAKALGKNVVALLSDEMHMLALASVSQGATTYSQMWGMVPRLDKNYDIKVDEKWLTLAPTKRVQTRSERIDREKWRGLIRSLRPGEPAKIEHYAAYARLSDNGMVVLVAGLPAILAGQGLSMDTFMDRHGDGDAFRIYGGLTLTQQKAARGEGFEVPLAKLDARSARAARRIVFAQDAMIAKEKQPPTWQDPNGYFTPGQENKPDTLLGAGAPAGSMVRLRVVQKELLFPRPSQEGYSRGQGMTAEQIGQNKAMVEVYPQQSYVDLSFVAMGTVDQLMIEFEFPGVGFLYKRAQVNNLPGDVVYQRISELPKEVRDKIDASYKTALEQYKKGKGGGG